MEGSAPTRPWPVVVLAVLALLLAVAPGCSSDDDAGGTDGDDLGVLGREELLPTGMSLGSTAFGEGQPIPERYSCEGLNVPPPLQWDGAPDGTSELALVIEDPDAPDEIFVHWLVVGIDAAATEVGPDGPPAGWRVLPGSSDNPTYIGPCPPDGDGPHRYVFQIYALDEPPRLTAGARPGDQVRAVRRAANAGGVLVGTFER